MKRLRKEGQGDVQYDIDWTTLAEYLAHLEKRGISPNVASYIGAATATRARRRPRRPQGDGRRDGGDARARAQGDGGGGARHRLVAHLRAGDIRHHRGAHRALQGRRPVWRQVHLPHPQRRRPPRGGGGRADPDRPRSPGAGRDLPPEGGGRGQLAEAGRGHCEGRGGPTRGLEDHRRHVHLHRGGHRVRRLPAPVGPRRRSRCGLRPARGPRPARAHRRRDQGAGPGLGEPVRAFRGPPSGCSCSSSRTTPSSPWRARPSPRSRPGAGRTGRRPSSISCTKTGRASAWPSSSCPRTTCGSRSSCPGSPSAPTRRRWRPKACS